MSEKGRKKSRHAMRGAKGTLAGTMEVETE